MFPILFKFGPVTIYSYGVMVALGFFMAIFFAQKEAPKFNIPKEFILDFGFWVIVFGIIGARLFYVVENLKEYLASPKEIFMLNHGGLSFFGGLFAGILAAVFITKKRGFSVIKVFDLLAPYLALAQSIGRVGCLLNGCCYGKNLIPTQIYSSIGLFVLFVYLRILQEKELKQVGANPCIRPNNRDGYVFYMYLILYSLGRFIIEFFRADNPVILFGLTLFQIISIILFFVSVFFLSRCKKSV